MLPERIAARRRNFESYRRRLADAPGIDFMPISTAGTPNYWLTCITIDPARFGASREEIRLALEAENIESRPLWKPLHLQPVFAGCRVRGGAFSGVIVRARLVPAQRLQPGGSRPRPRLPHSPRNRPAMMRSLLRRALGVILNVRSVRAVALTLVYAAIFTLSMAIAYLLRFDFAPPDWVRASLLNVCGVTVGVQLLCMFAFHQYDGLLSYFSTPDLRRLVLAAGSALVALGLVRWALMPELTPPGGVVITQSLINIMAISGLRLTFRRIRLLAFPHAASSLRTRKRVGIVGAGDCGAALAKETLTNPHLLLQPVAFFDDFRDSSCSIHGVPLVGPPERMAEFRDKLNFEEIIIAMPSAPPARVREILRLVQKTGLACRTVPSMDQLATGREGVSNLRPVDIRDLLGRPAVEIQGEAVRSVIEHRTVLVTGAGGSIGSELCRQILSYQPAELILVERSEPGLFLIEQELLGGHPGATVVPVVGDITQRGRMREVFRRFRPHVVFHAAAHKHVPMMEQQPGEAIRNNVFGTALLAELAVECDVDRFVLISTDKAVNPTNVMGATKRLAELYVQSLTTRRARTKFMAVRFGNVLGSSGSVVPTFTAPDRHRRPGHRHPSGGHPLLHDDPRGRLARAAKLRPRAAAATSSCSIWASRSASSISPCK